MTNYYEVLGVAQGSTPEEIRKSFRRRAKELHPDLSGDQSADSLEGMRLLLAAYGVLSDLEKRAEYDRTIGRKPARAQFDYREFLRGRVDDPYSQSKLIFHDLLTNHHDEALDLYERFTVVRGFPLERYLSREDYMDCAFLLAELLESRGRLTAAYALYTKLYRWERERPYFRHFTAEVVDRLRTLLCAKMLGTLQPPAAISCLEELIDLDFSRKDSAFFYKKLAEVHAAQGRQETALEYLRKGLQLDRKLPGVKKLQDRIGCVACLDNP
jgi:tetratricopeptide (TPR) repeat protein